MRYIFSSDCQDESGFGSCAFPYTVRAAAASSAVVQGGPTPSFRVSVFTEREG